LTSFKSFGVFLWLRQLEHVVKNFRVPGLAYERLLRI
jgi:hypothetical protein